MNYDVEKYSIEPCVLHPGMHYMVIQIHIPFLRLRFERLSAHGASHNMNTLINKETNVIIICAHMQNFLKYN